MVPPDANPSEALLPCGQLNAPVPVNSEPTMRVWIASGALEGVDGLDADHVPDDMGERNGSFRFFFLDRDGPR
jgi:hypothetical protein